MYKKFDKIHNIVYTKEVILCEHLRALDLNNRRYEEIEQLPKNILKIVLDIVYSEIEEL